MNGFDKLCFEPVEDSKLRILSKDIDGIMCRVWSATNPTAADDLMKEYCKVNPGDEICLCVERKKDKVYLKLQPKTPSFDDCWWSPCRDPLKYLIPSTIGKGVCPASICEKVNANFRKQHAFDIETAEKKINCHLEGNGTTWWEQYRWWIIGGIIAGVILIVLVVIIIFIVIWKKRKVVASK